MPEQALPETVDELVITFSLSPVCRRSMLRSAEKAKSQNTEACSSHRRLGGEGDGPKLLDTMPVVAAVWLKLVLQ